MISIRRIFFLLVLLIYLVPVQALTDSDSAASSKISEKARLKQYPGGQDDENIEVQEELPQVLQKVSKKEIEKKVYEGLLRNKEEKASQ